MSREQDRSARRQRWAGVAVGALGVAVLVVAIFALSAPRTSQQAAGTISTRSQAPAPTPRNSASPAPRTSAPRTSATRTPATSTAARGSASGRSSAQHSASSGTSSLSPATGRLPLIVLNNTTIRGLAKRAGDTFAAGGWTVTRVANYQNNILSTCAYYDPNTPGAQAAAQALQRQFPAIKRVKTKFPQLPAGPIVVVLTPDYTS